MCAPAAWQIHIVASRLSLSTLSQPDWRMSRNGVTKLEPPALFTTMSSWPSSLSAVRTASSAASPVGQVGRDLDRLAAQAADLPGRFRQPGLGPGGERDVGPRARERHRDDLADAARRAGHQRLLARQAEQLLGHSAPSHSVGSAEPVSAAGLTTRTISFSTIRT